MKKLLCDKKFNILYSLFAVLLMWAVWFIAAAATGNEYLVVPVGSTLSEFFALFSKAFFWKALSHTLLRTLITFLISFALALACACLSVAFKPFAAFMRPIAAFFRTLPTMAVLLLILTSLKQRAAPVAVAFLVLFPMIYSQLTDSISSVDGGLLQMARVYGMPLHKRLACIYLPHLAPVTLKQTGGNLAFGLKIVISAEVMAPTHTAIGGMLGEANVYSMPRLAALTLVAVALGILFEAVFAVIANHAFKWKKAESND
ncbi:MAG: ABC transporter permease subunit [Roseburia sp.]|nr:ABC transporter permease subunit [Roseburia sp.]